MDDPDYGPERARMLRDIAAHALLAHEAIGKMALDERVMAAMAQVPRHAFVPAELRPYAYVDQPLPIGYGKTISQPFMVALMTDLLELAEEDRVLEIGTGLGYQAAVLAALVDRVYTVELIGELAQQAKLRLKEAGAKGVAI